ncbi:MAG: hypothetical protein HQL51_17020, partial [Magnetococcales bacterium]|nr:hypothetical protein [Magnetococcales bacterium]
PPPTVSAPIPIHRGATVRRRARIDYQISPDYLPLPVNGVTGGVTPHGEITAHFYFEQRALPETVVHELDEHGGLGPALPSPGDPREVAFERIIVSGMALTLESARRIHAWLGERIREQEARGKR